MCTYLPDNKYTTPTISRKALLAALQPPPPPPTTTTTSFHKATQITPLQAKLPLSISLDSARKIIHRKFIGEHQPFESITTTTPAQFACANGLVQRWRRHLATVRRSSVRRSLVAAAPAASAATARRPTPRPHRLRRRRPGLRPFSSSPSITFIIITIRARRRPVLPAPIRSSRLFPLPGSAAVRPSCHCSVARKCPPPEVHRRCPPDRARAGNVRCGTGCARALPEV